MSTFDLTLLDPPRLPLPEAQASVEAAPMLEEPAWEIPKPAPVVKSEGDCILCIWNALLPSVGILLGSRPELLQERLEDIESWLCEWAHFEANACICTRDALSAETLLPIRDEEKEDLRDLNKWVAVAVEDARTDKEKGKGKEREENPDMECTPMVEPTTADDADDSGESEVEVAEVPKKVCPALRPVKPLPACPVAGPSRVCVDNSELKCLRADNERLRVEVDRLCTPQEDYNRFVQNLNYQARKQQQELITMSNRLYSFSDKWRVMGQEMDNFIVGQERA
ncbi:uncharacterized protein EDB93DRAFT_1103202 [Suillus bovinus]|uniref:uncharacterized protein n=1 Tax=Suillus bovinus TaxID=48563 RepID=UPI001B86A3AE|nr:uncharacterized protein EDB93DRAFT_1103202 [Suillus bovinus]KAG2151255.1 hypothetical protein EDB93DRAFT_1103202 [Suillus bovinus]